MVAKLKGASTKGASSSPEPGEAYRQEIDPE
jgi:hypothetical protein